MISRPIITLTTDFGLSDAYVGAMKGVILSIVSPVEIVDISHFVPPQDIASAAYLLASACPHFPSHAVHLAVVDPGVGTARKPIAVATDFGTFVGPDNGIFHDVLVARGALESDTGVLRSGTAAELANERYRLLNTSTTFHGRDIFAPAAAHLASGVALAEFGPRLDRLVQIHSAKLFRDSNSVKGQVRHIDHFGNAVTNISRSDMLPDPVVSVADHIIDGLSTTYEDHEITALIGSNGLLEIAVRNGHAAQRLGINVGIEVIVRSKR